MSMNVVSQRRHSPDISTRKEWERMEKWIEEGSRERGTKVRFDRDDVLGTKDSGWSLLCPTLIWSSVCHSHVVSCICRICAVTVRAY